jgi:hypothetical protein
MTEAAANLSNLPIDEIHEHCEKYAVIYFQQKHSDGNWQFELCNIRLNGFLRAAFYRIVGMFTWHTLRFISDA